MHNFLLQALDEPARGEVDLVLTNADGLTGGSSGCSEQALVVVLRNTGLANSKVRILNLTVNSSCLKN